MRCRKNTEYINELGIKKTTPIFFNSYGVDEFGHAKFINSENKPYINIINKKSQIKDIEEGEIINISPKPYDVITDQNWSTHILSQLDENGRPIIERRFDQLYMTNSDYDLPEGYIYTTLDNENKYNIKSYDGFVKLSDLNFDRIETSEQLNTRINKYRMQKMYSEKQESVKDSLIQRLSVIKGELWYKESYGLPLLDKIRNKGILDATIIDIITSQPDVSNLLSYSSVFTNDHKYTFSFAVATVYSEEPIQISLSFNN